MGGRVTSRSKHMDFIILDVLCVEVAFLLAYGLRMGSTSTMASNYGLMNIILVLVHMSVAFFTECYSGILRRGYLVELKKVLVHNFILAGVMFSILFLLKQGSDFSRIMFSLFFAIDTIIMWEVRSIRKWYLHRNKKNIKYKSRMLVVTYKDYAEQLLLDLQNFQYAGYGIVGVVIADDDCCGETILGVPVVANKDNVIQYVRTNVIDEVFLKCGDEGTKLADAIVTMGVKAHISMDRFMSDMPNATLGNVSDYTVVTSSINVISFKQKIIKRMMDICGAIVGLLITVVLFVIFAPIIFLQSPGPVFFSQKRVGKNGRIFKIYKFRSMYMDAEERKKELMAQNKMTGLMFKMDNDPRITPIGRFIRKTSIDEFPQFWNILKGDMSLVGTRPPTLDEYEKYELHHKSRLAIKPGLTGMWQVSGRSEITDFEEVVRLDNEYIKNFSLRLDVKILFKTVLVVFGKKGSV